MLKSSSFALLLMNMDFGLIYGGLWQMVSLVVMCFVIVLFLTILMSLK